MRKPLIAWAGTGAVEVTECCCASSSKQQRRGRAFLLFPLGWSAEVRRLMPPSARNSAALMCSFCEPPHLFPDIRLPPDERRNSMKRMVVWMRNERAVSWRQKKRCGECLAAHPDLEVTARTQWRGQMQILREPLEPRRYSQEANNGTCSSSGALPRPSRWVWH